MTPTNPTAKVGQTLSAEEAKEQVGAALAEAFWANATAAMMSDAALKAFGFRDWTQAAALMSGEAVVAPTIPTEVMIGEAWGHINIALCERGSREELLGLWRDMLLAASASKE